MDNFSPSQPSGKKSKLVLPFKGPFSQNTGTKGQFASPGDSPVIPNLTY